MEQNDSGVFKGQIRITPDQLSSPEEILRLAHRAANLHEGELTWARVVKRSIDARKKPVMLQVTVEAGRGEIPADVNYAQKWTFGVLPADAPEVLIVGSGPAGLYAALELIRQGVKPIIVERGKNVRDRRRDLAALTKSHIVDPDSNYCFGEGGAGTYSDGKLYTRAKKRGHVLEALEWLVAHGAGPEILVDSHPHIGTNRLPHIITSMRETIIACGGEVRFGHKLTDFATTDAAGAGPGTVSSATVEDLENSTSYTLEVNHIILSTGHSARDIFHLLNDKGLELEAKPFALGVRVEHPQSFIDKVQYHGEPRLNRDGEERLPAASYSLVCQVDGRGVHSFCMCPGGIIAPCATEPGEIVTNGWSPSKRNNPYANSGMVVTVDEEVWSKAGYNGPLAALIYQSAVEKACWEAAGRTQAAPAQRLVDFVKGRASKDLPQCSYHPGVVPVELHKLLPPEIANSLREGFKQFGRKINGFLHPDAIIVAPESRTSSPVKIPRDPATFQHPDAQGLYPCGEGGGYAGGILSAAMDGRKVAMAIAQLLIPGQEG